MSKVNIRFIYSNKDKQQQAEAHSVKSVHKGPIDLTNLYDTYANPSYQEISFSDGNRQPDPKNNYVSINNDKQFTPVATVQMISKPTSPRTAQVLANNPAQSIPAQSVQAQSVVQEPVLLQESKVATSKQAGLRPVLNLQEVSEKDFKKDKEQVLQKTSPKANLPEEHIVLKAPSFKYTPTNGSDGKQTMKKGYVPAEKNEKYLYSGIPEKSQDDFVGCFGCFDKKPKTYNIGKK